MIYNHMDNGYCKMSLFSHTCFTRIALIRKDMEHVSRNEYYTFQKVTQHGFDRLCYFNHGFIFVKLDITRKCVICHFYMFHWSVGRVSKLGAMSKTKVAQIDRIVRWYFPGESFPLEAVPQPRQIALRKAP